MSLIPGIPPLLIYRIDRRLSVSAEPSVQERTLFPFDNLQEDLQRRSLLSSGLKLHDLARVAVTCKQLRYLYHERCGADEHWLESIALAVFGEEFVELVLSLLGVPEDELPTYDELPRPLI
jgi:hypothetical protein